ncbi:MAG TPA: hypothetical protein VFA35_02325 [Burkholderiaceae bacterium]|nr:hypothetical protein [Burkholderiaceae bacterium]
MTATVDRSAVPRMTMSDLDRLRDWYGRMGSPRPHAVDIDRLYEAMFEKLKKDPILVRYIHHIGTANHAAHNIEPWTALGEQRYAAFECLGSALPESGLKIGHGNASVQAIRGERSSREFALILATRCLMAAPYLWTNEVRELVKESPLPPHVISRNVLPHPAVFFSSEDSLSVADAHGEDTEVETNWELLFDEGEAGFTVTLDLFRNQSDVTLATSFVPYGRKFPDDIPAGAMRNATEHLLQQLAFIRSPYTVTEPTRLPRPMRRELQRAKAKDVDPLVYVVKLRRAVERKPPPEESVEVNWQHHWWVSGHYRAQWHPSTKSHEVIWIGPHVKGPLDKPLLEKVYAVVR